MRILVAAFLAVNSGVLPMASAQVAAPRREPVTPELMRSAFGDSTARVLFERARGARLAQDSALRGYDAKSFLRLSVGMGVRKIGPEKLLIRSEQAARVRWGRAAGVSIQPIGRRTAFPMGAGVLDMTDAVPIPYFPGREALWLPYVGAVKTEIGDDDLIHPLANGAEAFYHYATGDSVTLRLPDGHAIALRELRITARKPDWRAFVGSFWFDVDKGSLVRAAYRLSADLDFWTLANEELKRSIDSLEQRIRTDTGVVAERTRKELKRLQGGIWDKIGMKVASGVMSPMYAKLSAVTVEYGLHEGRFWLPKQNIAQGEVAAGFMRMPLSWSESFTYNSVNGAEADAPASTLAQLGFAPDDTTWYGSSRLTVGASPDVMARYQPGPVPDDSIIKRFTLRADTLRANAVYLRAGGDTINARLLERWEQSLRAGARQATRHRDACKGDSTFIEGVSSRYGGAVRAVVRMPCDRSRLADTTEFAGSIYGEGEELFGSAERDELLKSLDFFLQPPWGPMRPVLHSGLDITRFNRVEGLSMALSAKSELGLGLTAEALGRFGTADRELNGELSLARSNGRENLRAGVFRRLSVANDDWGAPLSFGASMSNFLFGRDEGFYYRNWGAELVGTRDALGPLSGATLTWRAFAERQGSAGAVANTQVSLAKVIAGSRFGANIDAERLTTVGVGADVARTFGADPAVARLFTRARIEGALVSREQGATGSGYGRLVLDGTLNKRLGGFDVALSGGTGASAGTLPVQRAFYVGGLQTVRGEFPSAVGVGHVGDAFWLSRTDVGPAWLAFRPSMFFDVGWAGGHKDFLKPGRPLSGAGVGLSLIDGLVRIEAARGIFPEKGWRWDIYMGSRF
ncbi:MAG: hypothetical protein V4550_10005 [Gemmatimonadota bacterium]